MDRMIVALNGIEVGSLERHRSGAMSFRYLSDWLVRPGARPLSLSLPLSEQHYQGERVYNFFDNLLPDSFAIRTRIQARFNTATSHPFDLLSSIGRDCVGAIQLYPDGPDGVEIPPVDRITATPLDDLTIAGILAGYEHAPLGLGGDDEDFRISLAGAQEKTALLWYEGGWQRPHGSTPTSHIFKLPVGRIQHNGIDLSESVENEWLCQRIVQAFGLPVAPTELGQFGDQRVLIVTRFDRRWSRDGRWLMRLPQEDFCQALGIAPALKYESDGGPGIAEGMQLLLGSQTPLQDRAHFFRAQILFWMLAAVDGHAKNFSIFLEPDSAFRMTPLYDILSAHPLIAHGSLSAQKARMAMGIHGRNRHYRWSEILPRHFEHTAQSVAFSARIAREIMADMKARTGEVIHAVSAQLPSDFSAQISDAILTGLRVQAARLPD